MTNITHLSLIDQRDQLVFQIAQANAARDLPEVKRLEEAKANVTERLRQMEAEGL